jgi:GDPmannose 4,6-dehydratase
MGIAKILQGSDMPIYLGNLDAVRDWGHAKDYVEAMSLILESDKPDDFVVATGQTNTVRHFCELTFRELGVELEFKGSGKNEIGFVKMCLNPAYSFKPGQEVICIDPEYFRPTEVDLLVGDATKARKKLGWKPKYDLQALVREMVLGDLG